MGSPIGQLVPIIVENDGGKVYTLVDGERRWRAAKILGWKFIDCIVRPVSNHAGTERLVEAFVVNDQRADMSAMDKARAYKTMMDELGIDEVCRITGKSQGTIYPHIDLLQFESEIQALFEHKALSVTSRVVAALKRMPSAQRVQLAMRAATRGVSEPVLLLMCKNFANNHGLNVAKTREIRQERSIPAGTHFDAFNLVPVKTISDQVVIAAKETCRKCDLYDMANPTTCRQCPLVDFLRRL
jgi:ParB/RepB/Spo0J family partition protein